ncbi:MAG: GNAT family N-acetyltransferase [Candidatus Nanoarchaeia archaeon]|nr:GNAT family N-acetyltransferase [Candidatus Nanoarchaeia archaeon]
MINEFSMYEKSLNDLKKAIKLEKVSIVSDVWSDLKDYKKIENYLINLGFKIDYKKPVFYKKVSASEKSKLIFKINKKLIEKLFLEFIKKTNTPDFLDWKNNPKKGLAEMISPIEDWNLCAYNEKNELIGFFTLENNGNGYGAFLLIFIKNEYRGKNYAIEMIKKAEELLQKAGITEWYESTYESNIPMIKAFTKYGFVHKRDMTFFIKN